MIYLTYLPSTLEKNRICGHTFEVLDYFLMLRELNIESKIVIFENIDISKIIFAYNEKYNLDFDIALHIEKRKLSFDKVNYITDKTGNDSWVITSGFYPDVIKNIKFYVKNVFVLMCTKIDISEFRLIQSYKNFKILLDFRIYPEYSDFFEKENVYDYNKKIYFKGYNKLIQSVSKKTLIYINSNLRKLSREYLQDLSLKKEEVIFLSGTYLTEKEKKLYSEFGELYIAPVKNLFQLFDSFIITPTTGTFDCSPRFIVECKFYNKKIIIRDQDKDKIFQDLGTKFRLMDLNKDIALCELTKNDLLIQMLQQIQQIQKGTKNEY